MSNDQTSQDQFNDATERREYDKNRLDDDLKERLSVLTRETEAVTKSWLDDREKNRDANVAKKFAELYEEHPVFEFIPPGMTEPYISKDDVMVLAEQSVDEKTFSETKFLAQICESEIDKVIAVQYERDGSKHEVSLDRDFSDASRSL